MRGAVRISSAGSTSRITSMLMSAPRLMRRHRLLISSMREASETLKVAAKNVSPLDLLLRLR